MSTGTLKDGREYCQYYIERKLKREYFGRGLAARKAAQDRDAELKEQGAIRDYSHSLPIQSGVTFEELATAYMDIKSKTDLTPSSWAATTYKLASVIIPEIGHLQAARLTHGRLDEYVKKRLTTQMTTAIGPKSNPVIKKLCTPAGEPRYPSRSTINRELCDIQAIMNWAVEKQYLIANPVLGHKKPKLDNAVLKPPTAKETIAILNECVPHLIRALKISYFTGLRPGAEELFRLTWADVDIENKSIFIVSAKKKGLPYRTVPIHDELLDDLIRWKKDDRNIPSQHIINFQGRPVKSVKLAFRAAKRRAGITRRLRLYDFRHAFATTLLSGGSNLKTVSEILGHSRPDTTIRVYQHTNLEQKREEINKLPGLKTNLPENVIEYSRFKKPGSKKPLVIKK